MFDKLKDFFSGHGKLISDAAGAATARDVQIATTILLLEMAGSDEEYAPEEVQAIFGLLQRQFKVTEDDVVDLLEVADQLRAERQKIDEFVNTVNQRFTAAQKQQVLAMIWAVVFADGKVERFEERFAKQIKTRLQLTDEQAEAARKSAQAGKV